MARQIDTIANRITLEGGAEILKFLDSMGKDGEAAAKKLRDAFQKSGFDKGVTQKVGVIRKSLLGLGDDARRAAASFNPLRSALTGLQGLASGLFRGALGAGLGGGLAGGGLVAAIAAITSAAAKNAAAIKDQAGAFGITTDAIQKYQNLAISAGVPIEALNGVLGTLSDKVDENSKKLKTGSDAVEVFGGKTVNVVKGVKNLTDAVTVSGDKTIKVVRGVQDLNKELTNQSKLFEGISDKQFANGEAFDILAKRLQGVTDKFQAFRNEGLSKALSSVFSDLTNKAGELAKQAPKTGEAIGGLVKDLTPDELNKLDQINDGFAQLSANLSKLFGRGAANNFSFLGAALGLVNDKLVQFDQSAQNANKSLDGTKSALQVIFESLSGGGGVSTPGAGLSAGTGLLAGIPRQAADANAALSETKDSLTGIKAVLMGTGIDTAAPGAGLSAGTGLLPGIVKDADAAKTATAGFFDQFVQGAQQAATDAGQALSQTGQNVQIDVPPGAFAGFPVQAHDAAQNAAAELPPPFQSAFATIASNTQSAVSQIIGLINQIIAAARNANQEVSNLKASASSGGGSSGGGFGGGGGSGFAGGGQVFGPGSKTSDSILARLSRGEFVIKASAVDRYGPQLFHLLNSMRLPPDFLRHLRGFNTGGIVDALQRSFPVPRFAAGGPVVAPRASAGGSGQPLVLQLPGGARVETGLTVLSDGRRADVKGRQLAAGRKPFYWSL